MLIMYFISQKKKHIYSFNTYIRLITYVSD